MYLYILKHVFNHNIIKITFLIKNRPDSQVDLLSHGKLIQAHSSAGQLVWTCIKNEQKHGSLTCAKTHIWPIKSTGSSPFLHIHLREALINFETR